MRNIYDIKLNSVCSMEKEGSELARDVQRRMGSFEPSVRKMSKTNVITNVHNKCPNVRNIKFAGVP